MPNKIKLIHKYKGLSNCGVQSKCTQRSSTSINTDKILISVSEINELMANHITLGRPTAPGPSIRQQLNQYIAELRSYTAAS